MSEFLPDAHVDSGDPTWTPEQRAAEIARINAVMTAIMDDGDSVAAQAMAVCVLKCTAPGMCVVVSEWGAAGVSQFMMGLSTIDFVISQVDLEPGYTPEDRAELKARIGAPLQHGGRRVIFRFLSGVVMCQEAGVRFVSKGGSA